MRVKQEHALYTATTAASITICATACSFVGAVLNASAAATITVKDGASTIAYLVMSSGANVFINPAIPIACANSLTVTDSGGGNYTIFYGK